MNVRHFKDSRLAVHQVQYRTKPGGRVSHRSDRSQQRSKAGRERCGYGSGGYAGVPVTSTAFQPRSGSPGTADDAFVSEPNPALADGHGDDLVYSSYLGGNGTDGGPV